MCQLFRYTQLPTPVVHNSQIIPLICSKYNILYRVIAWFIHCVILCSAMYVYLTFLQCCTHGNDWKRWKRRFDSTGEQHLNNDMYLLINIVNQHVYSVVSRSFLRVRILNRCTPDSIREIAQLIMTIHPSYIIFSYYVYSFAPCLPKHQWAHSIVYSLLYYYISIICRHFAIGCTNLSRFGYYIQHYHSITPRCRRILPPTLVFV